MVSAERWDTAATAAPAAGGKQDSPPKGPLGGAAAPQILPSGRPCPFPVGCSGCCRARQRGPDRPRLPHLRPGNSVLITPSGPCTPPHPREQGQAQGAGRSPPAASTPSAARSPGGGGGDGWCPRPPARGSCAPAHRAPSPQSGCSRWAPGEMLLGVCIVFAGDLRRGPGWVEGVGPGGVGAEGFRVTVARQRLLWARKRHCRSPRRPGRSVYTAPPSAFRN